MELFEEEVEIYNRKKATGPPEKYRCYEPDETGVPPMADFGSGYRSKIISNMHTYSGGYSRDPEVFDALIRRLQGKILNYLDEVQMTESLMLEDAEVALLIEFERLLVFSPFAVGHADEIGDSSGLGLATPDVADADGAESDVASVEGYQVVEDHLELPVAAFFGDLADHKRRCALGDVVVRRGRAGVGVGALADLDLAVAERDLGTELLERAL